jgi:hypothetical protein
MIVKFANWWIWYLSASLGNRFCTEYGRNSGEEESERLVCCSCLFAYGSELCAMVKKGFEDIKPKIKL